MGIQTVAAANLTIGDPVKEDEVYASFPIVLALGSGETIVGLNLEISHSSTLTFHDAQASQAVTDAGKTLESNAPDSDSVRLVIYDMTHEAIPAGTIAHVRFTISEAAARGETVSVSYASAVAGDSLAQNVTVDSSSSFSESLAELDITPTIQTDGSNDDGDGCFIGMLTRVSSAFADEPTVPEAPREKPVSKASSPLIIDHTAVDGFDDIPDYWLDQAKQLTIHYAHTSHGSQIISGATYLEGLDSKYKLIRIAAGTETLPAQQDPPGIRMYDGNPPETYIEPNDYWDGDAAMNRTRAVANTGHYDFSMWSWCGQQHDNSETTVNRYLANMAILESEYPDMRFILMTGHLGSGYDPAYAYPDPVDRDTLKRNNDLVRTFASTRNMVLFDFADIEGHDGTAYCYSNDYHTEYNGLIVECEWPPSPSGCDSCAHSVCPNCVRKAKAFWYMMARLAGWDGTSDCPDPEDTDINQDCSTDEEDVSVCVDILLGRSSGNADVNQDNQSDIRDLILIINAIP